MSNDYSPVPGDSVKLVGKPNPDNVLYGSIHPIEEDGKWFLFLVDAAAGVENFNVDLQYRDWTITPWIRPVTFRPLAVVRLPEGWNEHIDPEAEHAIASVKLSRSHISGGRWVWMDAPGLIELYDNSIMTLLNHGAEILFEGVDPEKQT